VWAILAAARGPEPVSIGAPRGRFNGIDTPACPAGRWSDPQPVPTKQRASHPSAQHPNVAVGRTKTFVVGNNIPLFDGRMVAEFPLTVVELGGGYITPPPGNFLFVDPTAVVDMQERLHVLWAEPRGEYQRVDTDHWPRNPPVIWAARFDAASGWSIPEKVYDGKNLNWPAGPLVRNLRIAESNGVDRNGDGHIALPVTTFTGEPNQPLLLLRLRDGRWTADSVPSPILGGPATARFFSDGPIEYLGLLGAASDGTHDSNSVWFQRSTNGGRTWSALQLISRSGSQPAYWLEIAAGADGIVHLVWLQTTTGNNTIIRHTLSRDHGLTWSPVDDYAVPSERKALRATADSCGVLHIIYEDWTEGPYHRRLEYATWNGRWSTPTSLFPGWSSHTPSLALSAGGRPMIVFQGKAELVDSLSPDRLYHSEFAR
jgi:hypothetical protein